MMAKSNRELENEINELRYDLEFWKKTYEYARQDLRALMDHLEVYTKDVPAQPERREIVKKK